MKHSGSYFLLVLFLYQVNCQGLLYVGLPVFGGALVLMLVLNLCCWTLIIFECCRNCITKKNDRSFNIENGAGPGNRALRGSGRRRRRRRSSGNIEENQNEEIQMSNSIRSEELSRLVDSTSSENLDYSQSLFNVKEEDVEKLQKITTVPRQPDNTINSFVVSLKGEGRYFQKQFDIPQKFFFNSDLFNILEQELRELQSNSNIFGNENYFPKHVGLGIRLSRKRLSFFTEYCRGGNLRKFSEQSFRKKQLILYNLATHLNALSQEGHLYRRLNHKYILLNENLQIRLYDYRYDDLLKRYFDINTDSEYKEYMFYYTAPEVFEDNDRFSIRSTVYSFGLLMYELLTKIFNPMGNFVSRGESFFAAKVKTDPNFRPEIPSEFVSNPDLKWCTSLIELCWSFQETERPKFDVIRKILKEHLDPKKGEKEEQLRLQQEQMRMQEEQRRLEEVERKRREQEAKELQEREEAEEIRRRSLLELYEKEEEEKRKKEAEEKRKKSLKELEEREKKEAERKRKESLKELEEREQKERVINILDSDSEKEETKNIEESINNLISADESEEKETIIFGKKEKSESEESDTESDVESGVEKEENKPEMSFDTINKTISEHLSRKNKEEESETDDESETENTETDKAGSDDEKEVLITDIEKTIESVVKTFDESGSEDDEDEVSEVPVFEKIEAKESDNESDNESDEESEKDSDESDDLSEETE